MAYCRRDCFNNSMLNINSRKNDKQNLHIPGTSPPSLSLVPPLFQPCFYISKKEYFLLNSRTSNHEKKAQKILHLLLHYLLQSYFCECKYSLLQIFMSEYLSLVIISFCSYLNKLSTFAVIRSKLPCPFISCY